MQNQLRCNPGSLGNKVAVDAKISAIHWPRYRKLYNLVIIMKLYKICRGSTVEVPSEIPYPTTAALLPNVFSCLVSD
jgi:hypothetical protein